MAEEEAKTESKGWRMEVLEEKVLARRDRDRRSSLSGNFWKKDYRKKDCRLY